jgi:glutamate---cysteine ligase / carboxylate-amine ligase
VIASTSFGLGESAAIVLLHLFNRHSVASGTEATVALAGRGASTLIHWAGGPFMAGAINRDRAQLRRRRYVIGSQNKCAPLLADTALLDDALYAKDQHTAPIGAKSYLNGLLLAKDSVPSTCPRIEFQQSEAFTLGVEIELQLIDPLTLSLVPRAEELIAACAHVAGIKSEFHRSTVELCTGVCADVHDVERSLARDISELLRSAAALEVSLASTGCHPFSKYLDCSITRSKRYDQVLERHQWLSRRMAVYGLHVHIGMRSGEDCIRFHNSFLRYLPHLLALSASSPFWQGVDTGLASCRPTAYEALPTAGNPYQLRDWQEFEELCSVLLKCGSIQSFKDLWWDVRPSPRYGTLELRVCDGPATFAETLAITAFIHLLARTIDDRTRQTGVIVAPPPRWMVRDNKWRAMRHGLDAEIIIDTSGATKPLRDDLSELLDALSPLAAKLGYEAHVAMLRRTIREGNSSMRQRAILASRGSIEDVVRFNVAEFCAGAPHWCKLAA